MQVVEVDGGLTPPQVARIGLQVLDALEAAHARGVLHRDVKPANVLLHRDGERAVLTDFGIAALAGDPSLTSTGTFVGSPGYIAPERLREQPAGPESDLWSLGATLYTAVEGRPPFERDSPMAVLGAVLSEEPTPPRRAGSLGPLLWHLLRKDPDDRPPVDVVRRVLRNVAAGRPSGLPDPVPSPPVTVAAPRPGVPRGRSRRVWPAIVTTVAGAVVIAGVAAAVAVAASSDGRAQPSARFLDERKTAAPLRTPDPQNIPRDIPGLGDEAFGSDDALGDARATVFFRADNLTAEIEYRAGGRPIGSLRENALRAARWVEAALERRR